MPHIHLPEEKKVKVTIITGFLGSGKSTLLNHILRYAQGQDGGKYGTPGQGKLGGPAPQRRNIAVIENEFGEISIDKTIVGDQLLERENLVSMEGGCVCCSLRKDVVKAFVELEQRAKARDTVHDHILLETTGLADPSPLAFTFFANPWIAARFNLVSIVCVVDAKHLMQHLVEYEPGGDVNEAVQQLAFADIILLNKVDLVDEAGKLEVLAAIKQINNNASIIECRLNGERPVLPSMEHILDANSFSVSRALQIDPQFMDSDSDSGDDEEDADNSCLTNSPVQHLPHQHEAPSHTQGACDSKACEESSYSLPAQDVQHQRQPQHPQHSQHPQQQQQQQPHCTRDTDSLESKSENGHEQQQQQQQQQPLQGHGGPQPQQQQLPDGLQQQEPHSCCRKRQLEDTKALDSPRKEKRPRRRVKLLHDRSDISSVGLQARGSLDEYRFNMFMRDLLMEKAKDIYRCKGVLAVHGYGNKKFVFQGVHETICYGPADHPWREDEEIVNQIVFIGHDLDRKALVQGFRTCVWSPLPEGWVQTTDPKTGQPYYWNKCTRERSWLRPTCPPTLTPLILCHNTLCSPFSGTKRLVRSHGCAPRPAPLSAYTMHPQSSQKG